MRKRTPWRVVVVPLSCLLFLAVVGPGRSQPPGAGATVPDKIPTISVTRPDTRAPNPPSRSLDDLLAQLAKVREQRAELEKQEKALVEELRARHQAQTEALIKFGVLPLPAPRAPKAGPDIPDISIPGLKDGK